MNYLNHDKAEILSKPVAAFFKSFNRSNFLVIWLQNVFHIYKMSKDLSVKYFQDNKERLQKKAS